MNARTQSVRGNGIKEFIADSEQVSEMIFKRHTVTIAKDLAQGVGHWGLLPQLPFVWQTEIESLSDN